MARITYGKKFRTKRGRWGRYKYVNGKKVAFVGTSKRKRKYVKRNYSMPYKTVRRYGPWKR